jgi:hypothetical protein
MKATTQLAVKPMAVKPTLKNQILSCQTHPLGAATRMVMLATGATKRTPAEGIWVKTTGVNRFAFTVPVG